MSKHKHLSTRHREPCPGCGVDHDTTGSICRGCLAALRRALVDLPAYWSDVDTVRAGQTRYTGGGGRSSGDIRLGMDLRFGPDGYGTRVLHEVRSMVVGWVRIGVDEHPEWPWPADTMPGACSWLHDHADWLRSSVHGPLAYEQVMAAVTSLRSLVDRPADRWYAGVCGARLEDGSTCKAELRPRKPEGSLRCGVCGTIHDIDARRRLLLEEAQDRAMPVPDLSRAICWLGEFDGSSDTLAARVHKWAQRGRLLAWSHEARPRMDGGLVQRPCYRVRDVLDLLAEDAAAQSRRAGNRRTRVVSA